jgi:NADH-quinone oxidoreductase subunit K
MPPFVYIFLGALAVVSALGVVVQRNPVHSLLALIGTLLTVAILFIAEDAVVVGFLQIIVYAGAIMILFLFVIWLLNLQTEVGPTGHLALKFFGSIAAALLVTELFFILAPPHLQVKFTREPAGYGSLASLAGKLFTDYLGTAAGCGGRFGRARAQTAGHGQSACREECRAMIPLTYMMSLSAMIFAIGVAGVIIRRNILVMLMSIELMLNAVNLAFIAIGSRLGSMDGQVIVFFVMTVAAAEAAVGLGIIISIFRNRETVHADDLTLMRW